MRIAFASCMCTRVFEDQPVWDWIAEQRPDHLVLLGDAIYIDVSGAPKHPKKMDDNTFAEHLHTLYTELLTQPQFAALLRQMGAQRVWSIWDDHDFLWDNAAGAFDGAQVAHVEKLRLSTAFHEAFRLALSSGQGANRFPAKAHDAVFWQHPPAPLSTPSIRLSSSVWLHLTDGRTWRTRPSLLHRGVPALLGADQRKTFEKRMQAQPEAIHLIASGSTLGDYKTRYPDDWHWMLKQAAARRTLVLSGDIHRNETDAFFTPGFPLHEATSSGAAVRSRVTVGAMQRNHGLLDIQNNTVSIALYAHSILDKTWSRTLTHESWLPISA